MKKFIKKSMVLLMAGAMVILPVSMSVQAKEIETGSIYSTYSSGTITADGVRMRSTPSTSGTVLALLYKGERVQIISASGGWTYCQTTSGIRGYVLSQYVS